MTKMLPAAALFALASCAPTWVATSQAPPTPASGLEGLSDEFDSGARMGEWKRVDQAEGWNADQLARMAVENGHLVLVPHCSTWYMDYRGVLVFKEVTGDFVVSAKLACTGRDGRSAPRSLFSLGGLMARAPRADSARTWKTGGENYVFLSLGAADQPGTFQFEVKTTTRSASELEKVPASGPEAELRMARLGGAFVLMRRQGRGGWVVQKRYQRPDMPQTLQVGLTVYTDYPSASRVGAWEHNGSVNRGGNPDLMAKVDYVRFSRPAAPGLDLARASDAEVVRALGG